MKTETEERLTTFSRSTQTIVNQEEQSTWVLLELAPDSDMAIAVQLILQSLSTGLLTSAVHRGGGLSDALLAFSIASNCAPWLHLKLIKHHERTYQR